MNRPHRGEPPRKKDEECVREDIARSRVLFQSMTQGVVFRSAEGTYLDVNPAALKIYGVSRKEFLAADPRRPRWKAVRENGSPLPYKEFPALRALRTGKPVHDTLLGLINARTGKTHWVIVNAIPEFRRGVKKSFRVVLTLHDITERRAAQEAARETGALYRILFENIREGVSLYEAVDDGRDFVFRDLNPATLKQNLTRKSRAYFIGKRISEIFPPIEQMGILEIFRRVWRTGKTEYFPSRYRRNPNLPEFWRENWVYRLPGGEIVAVSHDISRRMKAEADLRESEDRFKYIFDHAPVGVSITSPDGSLNPNRAFCDMLGYSREELRERNQVDLTHTDDRMESNRVMRAIMRGEQASGRLVKRYIHKNGSTVWADLNSCLRRDEAGRPLYFITVAADITERVRAEEALLASEQRFRELFESMKELVVLYEGVFDKNGCLADYRILDVNRAFEDGTGIPREGARDRLASELHLNVDIPLLEKFDEMMRTGKSAVFEMEFPPLNKIFSVSAFVTTPGCFAAVMTDITERKRMETRLRESEERYRALFDTSDDAILLMKGGFVVDCNEGAVRLYGVPGKSELIGRSPWDVSPIRQPDGRDSREKAMEAIAAAVAGRPQRFTWRNLRGDGSPIDGEVALNALTLGNEIYVQTIVRDIGDRLRAEEEIRRSLEEKETLLREIYHRTKNNMNVIGAMLSLRARHLDDPKATEVFREIEEKIRGMSLVHEKLYKSKDLHRIDLREYIAELSRRLLESHKDAGFALDVKLDLEEIPVPIDTAIPCGMILNELFSNAFKHAFRGAARGEIRIRLARTGGERIELSFGDSGAGVPDDFDFRNQPSLGLQMLIMLAEHQLKGAVRFETKPGLACRIVFPERGEAKGKPS